ncbi:hypothetical protein DR980_15545 [Flavobacterium psychrolimnae]|uniref:Uncharacterized protein n=1 Tax=Flavobacterium psychrolimnae TaxID=249351 RepID=A0A366AW40_9FLAO|nr:hypothetical protein DR980_15545 [Flavobacterium psychrolimnae]
MSPKFIFFEKISDYHSTLLEMFINVNHTRANFRSAKFFTFCGKYVPSYNTIEDKFVIIVFIMIL